jgi:hypothetical protein
MPVMDKRKAPVRLNGKNAYLRVQENCSFSYNDSKISIAPATRGLGSALAKQDRLSNTERHTLVSARGICKEKENHGT